MMLAASMATHGRAPPQIAAALGMSPSSPLAMRAIEGARRFGIVRLNEAYRRVAQLDADFKNGRDQGARRGAGRDAARADGAAGASLNGRRDRRTLKRSAKDSTLRAECFFARGDSLFRIVQALAAAPCLRCNARESRATLRAAVLRWSVPLPAALYSTRVAWRSSCAAPLGVGALYCLDGLLDRAMHAGLYRTIAVAPLEALAMALLG